MTDIVAKIWSEEVPNSFPVTAEGRADVDDRLRSRLNEIEDDSVRHHAAQLIREKRIMAMHRVDPSGLRGTIRYEVESMLRRKGVIE